MKKANSTIRLFLAAFCCFLMGNGLMAQTDVDRTFNTGGFLNETGWEIVNVNTGVVYDCEDAGAFPNAVPGTITLPGLPDGDYEVIGFDSFGDGWNGGSMTVRKTVGQTVLGNCLNATHTGGGNNTCNNIPSPGGTAICAFSLCAPCSVPLSCPADISVNTQPGICAAVVNFNIGGNCPSGIDVDVPSGSTFPPGNTVVTATACDNSVSTSCSFNVFVADLLPPVLDCPPNRVVDLAPGLCCQIVSFDVKASDNCPFEVFGGTVLAPGTNSNGQTAIAFDIENVGTDPITVFAYQIRANANVVAQVWVSNGPTGAGAIAQNQGNWTLLGTAQLTGAGGFAVNAPLVDVPVGDVPLAPGASKGIYIAVPGTILGYSNGNATHTDGNLAIVRNNHRGGTHPFGGQFSPRAFHGSASYNISQPADDLPVVQIAGPASGSELCADPGSFFFEFEAFDAQNNRGTCSFTVTVNDYAFPTQNLTCNDNVQVSLDENCEVNLNADMVLEGGPYGCYDTRYDVQVLNAIGGMIPQPLGAGAIGKTYTVKVIDNVTNQSCWGSIVVKDKLKPTLECRSLTIACTEPLPNEPAPAFTGPLTRVIENINEPLGEPGAPNPDVHSYDFDYSFYPPGTPVEDVDVIVKLVEHTWLPDLDIVAANPAGDEVDVFQVTGCFGAEFDMDLIFDDEGLGGVTMCAQLDAGGGRLQCFVAPGVQNNDVLTEFDGTDASGIWSLTYSDNALGDDGIILTAGLIVTANAPAVVPTDNCGSVTVTVEENYIDDSCGGPAGQFIRTWTATDNSGNSESCTQIITLSRPSVADIEIPANIKWTCTQYDIFPNVTSATAVHPYITDCDAASALLDATCYSASCDDLDFAFQDNPAINSTTTGGGCPGFGLDDADVLAITGSGYPTVNGQPLISICEIGVEYEDIVVQECVGTFKIVRQWTIIDWCSNPIAVRQENQVIKVVDEEAPIIELFGVDGKIVSQYGNSQIPALGNFGNPNTTGGCGQAPQNTGGTVYTALVQLPGTGAQFNPDQFTNIRLESVLLSINHQHVEDLDIFLKGPSNKVIELSTDNGINGVGYHKTKFVDDPSVPVISAGASPFTGKFRPEGTFAISCGGFNGTVATLAEMSSNWQQDVLGTWELIIFDDSQDNIGEMVEWKLNFSFGDVTIDVYDATASGSIHTVCEGSVLVPPIQDCTDNCSGVESYITQLWTVNNGQPQFQIGTINGNGGYFTNVPLFQNGLPARYVARYYAVDGCKNQSFVDMNIRLRDKVPPVAICDEITEIAITNNGQGTGSSCSRLYPENLDDGSYDNCSPIYFLMAKMDDSFSQDIYNRCYYPWRDFCCEDVGSQTVIVLVLDQDPTPLYNTTITSASLGCDKPTPNFPSLFLSPNGINATIPGTQQLVPVNFNTCMVTVNVTDKLPPVLQSCPGNERISCDLYASNFETQLANAANATEQCNILSAHFGTAKYFDNCVANVTCNVTFNLDQCLEGTVRRTWTATDGAGNTNSSQNCTQTIFVDHVSDFVVEFPQHRNGEPTHLPAVECGNDVPDFGEPEIFYETCELVAVSYEDQILTAEPDACYKILRQWTVINWCVVGDQIDQEVVESSELALRLAGCLSIINLECDLDGDGDCDDRTFRDSWAVCNLPDAAEANNQFGPDSDPDSNPWDGFITYQQQIKVEDTVNPVFTNGCAIPDVCISDNTCAASVLLPTPDVDECSPNPTFTYQITIGGTTLNGAGPYLNVAPGTYPVRYVVADNCGNQTACQSSVTVRDCKKPTPYCKNGIIVELMVVDPAMVEVWASDLNDNSFDNCPGALKYSFSADVNDIGRTFTCDDLGQNSVDMWVTDAAGNQDFCKTFVIVQANMDQCVNDTLVVLAGQTATEFGDGVQDVTVNINSPSGFDASVTTDANGSFFQKVPPAGDYTVTPVYDVNPLNGVTTFDLVKISKHILNIELLDSPYKMIAADVNKSNSITTFDLVQQRKLILFINTDFPNNTSWRFIDKDYVFNNPANPFAENFPEVINLNNLSVGQMANDFVAVKVGDVNGSASVNFASAEDRNMVGDLVLNTEDLNLTEGQTYTVEFKATEFAVSGYQFTLNFDNKALAFDGIVPGLADESNFGLTMVNEGVITTSWNSSDVKTLATGDVVFGLTFTAKQGGRLSDLLNVNSRYTVAEAYTADAELLNVALSFNNTKVADGFELYQNAPNPFATTTIIGFYLPEATSATLTISDVQGKVVKVIERDFVQGYNQEILKRSDLGATGVLYYRLDTDTDSATRMMILVD